MQVYSYIVRSDNGFAPNPFHGFCTLACCKPRIRATAKVGDIVVGTSSRGEQFIFAMKVSAVVDFAEYWTGARYAAKRPTTDAARAVERRGDNIYPPDDTGGFRQLPSFHSNKDGTENVKNKRRDLSGEKVLVADRFTYFGSEGPPVPSEMDFLRASRGHRCRFTSEQVAHIVRWFEWLPVGIQAPPMLWSSGEKWCQR